MGTGTACRYGPWSLEVPDLNSGARRFWTSRDGAGVFLGVGASDQLAWATTSVSSVLRHSSPFPVSTSWYLILPITRLRTTRRISPVLYDYWIGHYLTAIIITYQLDVQPRWRPGLTDTSSDIHSFLPSLSSYLVYRDQRVFIHRGLISRGDPR